MCYKGCNYYKNEKCQHEIGCQTPMYEFYEENTEHKILTFLSEYAEGILYDAEQETNSFKSKDKFKKHEAMREIINALIDDLKTQ